MKKVLLLLVLFVSFATVHAQTAQSTDEQTAQTHATQMKKLLGLTDAQTTQVQTVLLNKITKIHAIQADATKNDAQKKTEIDQVDADTDASLATIFTPDQNTQYLNVKKTRQARAATDSH